MLQLLTAKANAGEPQRIERARFERIVVRGVNWVGDTMMTIPALRRLREVLPRAHITLVVRPQLAGIFVDADFIDDLLLYERSAPIWTSLGRQIREWRARAFDTAILLQNAFEAALIARTARVPCRIGYATDNRGVLLTDALQVPAWRGTRHEVFYYLNIIDELERLLANSSVVGQSGEMIEVRSPAFRRKVVAASEIPPQGGTTNFSPGYAPTNLSSHDRSNFNAGVDLTSNDNASLEFTTESNTRPRIDLYISESRRDEARQILRAHGARENQKIIALCPGSINSRSKRWTVEGYAQLADRLIEESESNVVLIGSNGETDVTQAIVGQMRQQPIVLTGRTTLAETIAALSITNLLVTNDTGPAHIAAGVECPTLVIFGPTVPATTRPFSNVAEIIRRPPACAPCMLRDCPIDHRCMTAITPEEVYERARLILFS